MYMNIGAMLNSSVLPIYWNAVADESWYQESVGEPVKDAKSGTLGDHQDPFPGARRERERDGGQLGDRHQAR